MNYYEFEICKHFALKCLSRGCCVLVGKDEGFSRCSEIIRFINILDQCSNHLEGFKVQIYCLRQSKQISLYSCLKNQFVGLSGCKDCQQKGRDILQSKDLSKILPEIEEEIKIRDRERSKGFSISQGLEQGSIDDEVGGY